MHALLPAIQNAVRRERLVATAVELIGVPSPTGDAGAVSDRLAELLRADGFRVERHTAGHAAAPAVVVRWESERPGRCLQFNGHLDTVHLPFVPPQVEGGLLKGSGASDMKGGLAAAIEALHAVRDSGLLQCGSILLTAHDLHEAPWGFGQQLDQLIRDGIVGDAVLIPEPLCDRLPVVGRGAARWKVRLRRSGHPVHEVMRPADEPSVIAAAARLVDRLNKMDASLQVRSDPLAGCESVFIGQVHAGEIYNQYPQESWLEGTRRWLPDTARDDVERAFRELVSQSASDSDVQADIEYRVIRNAFRLVPGELVPAFQQAYAASCGRELPAGPKPFVDDGNSFWAIAGVPVITHGPRAGGQHTVNEWADIDDLVRVAQLYALTAVLYCPA
jgi:acetylornithine deacetylase/succinyl-diaminopimelate desuccinylase-like protein